jgi:RNA polymerase sigma factor (sigma-70 family)
MSCSLSLTLIAMRSEGTADDGAGTAARGSSAFATTHWSLVGRAVDAGTEEGCAALEELCRTYWRPLYWFARRRGLAPADAEDLTQGFFEDLLGRNAIAHADPARGRFRTFLLTAFAHFQSHERARARCLKHGGGCRIISVEELRQAESRFSEEPATTDSPEMLFDRAWALSMFERTLDALAREYGVAGKSVLFEELTAVLWGGRGEDRYEDIGKRVGSTEGAIKVAVHRLRQRFRELLRAEVAKTLLHPEEADDELRHLFAALGA